MNQTVGVENVEFFRGRHRGRPLTANDRLHRFRADLPVPTSRRGIEAPPNSPRISMPDARGGQIIVGPQLPIVVAMLEPFDVFVRVSRVDRVPSVLFRLRIEQNHVMNVIPFLGGGMGGRPFPDVFIAELVWSKDSIHKNLEIMARGRVAMEVNARRRLHDAA